MQIDLELGREHGPLYMQVALALEQYIERAALKPGDVLPSETVLASENRLSRATIIKAFDVLVERGVVVRRQGRGTFVSGRPMERQLPELVSFSDHVHGLGLVPGSALLSFDLLPVGHADRPEAPFADTEPLVRIERIRTVGGRAVGLHRTVLAESLAKRIGLTERTAAHGDFSFYGALRSASVFITDSEEQFRAINGDALDTDLLGVEEGTALIEIVRTSRDAEGRLVEVVRARYLGSHYRYHIHYQPASPRGPLDETTSCATARSGGSMHPSPDGLLRGSSRIEYQ